MNALSVNARRRVRSQAMASELGISLRKLYEIQTLGLPCTRLQGVTWYEPEVVHRWLDKFSRKGAPGVKRVRGMKVAKETAGK